MQAIFAFGSRQALVGFSAGLWLWALFGGLELALYYLPTT